MLQILRAKAQGTIAWIIVLFVGVAFAFFGLGDYFLQRGDNTTAAKIGDQKISWQSVDNIYKRVSAQYGNQVEPKILKNQILTQLIRRLALIKEVKTLGFRVGDEQVAELLVSIPAFQVDGQFSKEQYLKTLAEANYTEVGFRQELGQDFLLGQLEQGINQSSFITPMELKNIVGLVDQKRDFGYMILSANQYKKDITISDDQIKSYYDQHKASLVKPEQVVLEYVELSLSKLAENVKLSEEEILAFYEAHQTAFTSPERVHARHILISAPKGDAALDAKAKAKIEAILVELKQGADFSKIATMASNDLGSAKNGGDLGWFVRGQMVPEFEKVAFELTKAGSIGGPVQTQFGYHLIQLIEHKNTEVRPLKAVKTLAEAQLKRERAEALFAEKAEILVKSGFEQSTLDPIAKQLGLKKEVSVPFGREGGAGIASNPEVVKVAFSETFLKEKHNSEPIKISDDATVIIRVKEHQPSVQETLVEARAKIADRLIGEGTREQAKSIGEGILKKIQKGENPLDLARQQKLNWTVKSKVIRSAADPNREVVVAAFQIPDNTQSEKPPLNGFSLPNGDYLVLALNKVVDGDWSALAPDVQASYKQGLAEFSSQLEYALYASQVSQAAKVKLFKDPL
ncbi:MAG TPA: SurA N-terminal domain-containing protein [Gammaproteobacteria bacterium]|nr:SurA N-terminal domain-containing protein [Gammaproteobacteria bacterium]